MLPSLVSICLSTLSRYPDQLPDIPRLRHRAELNDIDVLSLDAKAWATLIQLYDSLPGCLSTFSLPLHDPDMPLLQTIPSTPRFTLITVLEAPACRALSDENMVHLKSLHTLTALDVSENASITSHGLIAFASTLHIDAGPWPLRILRLRNCSQITSAVYPHLTKFPLLSVVDLRGTKCARSVPPPQGFSPKASPLLFHPQSLSESLSHLHGLSPDLYSSPSVFTLLVNELRPKKPATEGLICHDNTVVTLTPTDHRLYLDNANAIARRVEAREEHLRHEENSAAWHRRRELLELSKDEFEEMYPLPVIRRKFLKSTQSRLAAPHTSASTLPSGFQPISRSRSTNTRPRTDTATPRASVSAPRPAPRNLPPPRLSANLPSGFQPLPSTTGRPTSNTPSSLPNSLVRANPYSPSLPNGFQSTPLSSTRPLSRPATAPRPNPRASSRQGVQGPHKPDASSTPSVLWVDPADEPFMLFRPPPPYSTLHSAQSTLRAREAERRDIVKRNLQARAADIAQVDREGKKAMVMREKMGSLLVKRREVREVFGLQGSGQRKEEKMVTSTPMPSGNPFKRRVTVTNSLDKSVSLPAAGASSREQGHGLIPISKVPKPLFTQDLLDASAKENKKAGLTAEGSGSGGQVAKKQRRTSLPSTLAGPKGSMKSKQPRASEGGGSGATLDLRKWLVPK